MSTVSGRWRSPLIDRTGLNGGMGIQGFNALYKQHKQEGRTGIKELVLNITMRHSFSVRASKLPTPPVKPAKIMPVMKRHVVCQRRDAAQGEGRAKRKRGRKERVIVGAVNSIERCPRGPAVALDDSRAISSYGEIV